MASQIPGPNQCFISHSYGDAAAVASCVKRRLPKGWAPFVFPAIDASPEEAVSAFLVDAIRASEGLVYLKTPVSLSSFWVAFERNMAARLGKPVFAFYPRRPVFAFRRDDTLPPEPMISVLLNLCVDRDVETIQRLRDAVWDRYRFEIRGDQWQRLDNEARQMFDSIEGMQRKLVAGGVGLVFLSNESICSGHHDYVDPFTYHRARKDMETPIGYTAEKFGRLDPARSQVIWLEPPDAERIEAALQRFAQPLWGPYVDLVRTSLGDPNKIVLTRPAGEFDRHQLDAMVVRCFWTAHQADPTLAASFRARLAAKGPQGR